MPIIDISSHGDRKAFITDDGATATYAALYADVKEAARLLPAGTLSFILCSNTPGGLAAYLTAAQAGCASLLLDSAKGREVIDNLVSIYRPATIWCPQGDAHGYGGTELCHIHGYSLVALDTDPAPVHPDLALLLTTSGTTGSPKLVRLSAANLRSNAASIASYLGIDADERPVTSLPMHYSYGLSVINSHLLRGATLLLTDKSVMQREFWDFASHEGATSIAGVPYTYEMLRRLRVFRMDLPALKTMTQAGGRLRPELAREFAEHALASGRRFFVMYGQTEATARMSYIPQEHAVDKCGSIGIAIPGGKLSIDGGEDEGELIYEGPNVSLGYAERAEDLLRGDDNHGVLHTGDLARMDSDGFFYITGRLKRFVKVWGNRCNLDSVEEILKEAGYDCACTGIDDLITVHTTYIGHEADIKALLCRRTGLNARAFYVNVIEDIPRTQSGKTLYSVLQEQP